MYGMYSYNALNSLIINNSWRISLIEFLLSTGENNTNETDEKSEEEDEDEPVSWLRRIKTAVAEFIDAIPQPKLENSPSESRDKDIAGPPDET